ncbi:hypothetical protein ALI144C_01335 [Actinosynnema sp. ALI-1.44]|uniref:SAM-dependent methyltransferase n=1 Tax=Actinosynnema sp. ALI-1.44 TaxID=1933779 RepID=UPI00097CB4CB|nr:SAM-dependent methyltransferase [Actinosynnema sp. ALI-1.44]ONI91353.1 hypothetical protein ALI144C_01335 [Actinosynnema sp. ALI-1.44]
MTRGEESPDVRDAPARVNIARASITRVYDALLGGKDNFQVDRDVMARFLRLDPEFVRVVRDRRDFIMRATRYLAGQRGVTQFLDVGATLPEKDNPHDVAQRLNREATMVYASMDPGVLAHGRAQVADNDRTHMAEADFRNPRQMVEHPVVAKHLNFDEPVALFIVSTLQHVRPEKDPAGIMAGYVDLLAPGSYVVFGHWTDPGPSDPQLSQLARDLNGVYRDAGVGAWPRSRDEIEGMLAGLELLDPGLAICADWWPDGPRLHPLAPSQRLALGAVGVKR